MSDVQFERLREELGELVVPKGQARNLRWLATPLAIGRTASGDYEIFIRATELRTSSALVRRHVQHGDWRPKNGGEPFPASRIILPAAPHFASIAALIAVELMRAGIAEPENVQAAFTDVEPIIEMAIRRGALSEAVIIGLMGELTVLRQLLLAASDKPEVMLRRLDTWQGWQEGGRDFKIGDHAIEVKTTQGIASIHEFSGLHQLEPHQLPSGNIETLHLMSVGLAASTTMGESLPAMVSSVAGLAEKAGLGVADEFIRRVSLYGAQSGTGYAHATMQDWSVYGMRYAHTFLPRLYRIDDPAMRLLSRDMLSRTFVQTSGLAFTLHVPERLSVFNPAEHWEAELESMASERPA